MGRSKKHPWQDDPPREKPKLVADRKLDLSPSVRVDLGELEELALYLDDDAADMEEIDEFKDLAAKSRVRADLVRAAVAEITRLRRYFMPGLINQSGG